MAWRAIPDCLGKAILWRRLTEVGPTGKPAKTPMFFCSPRPLDHSLMGAAGPQPPGKGFKWSGQIPPEALRSLKTWECQWKVRSFSVLLGKQLKITYYS